MPKKSRCFNLGFGKKKAEAQSGCKNPTLLTLLNCERWDAVEHDPKGHGLTSDVNLDLENIRAANFKKHCTLHNKHYRIHASMGCLHIPPNCVRMLLCINPVKKIVRDCFLVSVKKTKAMTNVFSGKVTDPSWRTPNRKLDLKCGSNVSMKVWKSLKNTVRRKKGYKKEKKQP